MSLTSGSASVHQTRVVSIGAAWLVTTGDDDPILEIYDMEDPFEPYLGSCSTLCCGDFGPPTDGLDSPNCHRKQE